MCSTLVLLTNWKCVIVSPDLHSVFNSLIIAMIQVVKFLRIWNIYFVLIHFSPPNLCTVCSIRVYSSFAELWTQRYIKRRQTVINTTGKTTHTARPNCAKLKTWFLCFYLKKCHNMYFVLSLQNNCCSFFRMKRTRYWPQTSGLTRYINNSFSIS